MERRRRRRRQELILVEVAIFNRFDDCRFVLVTVGFSGLRRRVIRLGYKGKYSNREGEISCRR